MSSSVNALSTDDGGFALEQVDHRRTDEKRLLRRRDPEVGEEAHRHGHAVPGLPPWSSVIVTS